MKKINMNLMAEEITAFEGKKKQVNIAQVKEVLKIALGILGRHWNSGNEEEVIALIKRVTHTQKQRG